MQCNESWLRKFCNPKISSSELADTLTMSGLEVEERAPVAPPFTGIVVAEILEAVQHPNADRLRVCKVNAGSFSPNGPLQIVCGAPNARAGIRVPLATVGAVLPHGKDGQPFTITVGKLRGVDSYGMLCSESELGLPAKIDGLLELPGDAAIGMNIREYLDLDDTIFTLKLTPNLAHNLSVYGIAREISALTGTPLISPVIEPVTPVHTETLKVTIEAKDLCGRFTGRVIKNVNTKAKTPSWMADRLERCGQRPVSAIVDISNYVMFEYGQPNHIFDLDTINGGLDIRWAKPGESLTLLNGKTVELDGTVGVVADHKGVESIAGIMGGDRTSVTDDTKNIYLEAAFWHPNSVAGRSRRFNFATEAGHRFERGVDPNGTKTYIEHLTRLVLDICGGEPGPVDDQIASVEEKKPVTLRVARAAKIIGLPVTQEQCKTVLTRLGLSFKEEPGAFHVTPPSWRFDICIEEDLIEEIIRVLGYHTLPNTPPIAPIMPNILVESKRSPHTLRRRTAALAYQETINFGFVEERWEKDFAGNENPIKLLNPIASQLSVMRSSLIGSLIDVLKHNLARKATRVRVFELGHVFIRNEKVSASLKTLAGIDQPLRLAGLAYGAPDSLQWGNPDRPVDFYDVKGDVEALLAPQKAVFAPALHPAMHPSRCTSIKVNGAIIGHVGELHPRWCQVYDLPQAPVLFELDGSALLMRPMPCPQPISKFQPVFRDLALIFPIRVTADELIQSLRKSDTTEILRDVTLFDVYRPAKAQGDIAENERSLAIRLELLNDEAPLTDDAINSVMEKALETAKKIGGRIR